MFETVRNLLSPKRRKAKREITAKGVDFITSKLLQQLIAGKAAIGGSGTYAGREKVRVVTLYHPDWGFSDASFARLQEILEQLGDIPADVSHRSLTVCLAGDAKKEEFDRAFQIVRSAAKEPVFEGVLVGTSDGFIESWVDVGRITDEARRNRRTM